MQYPYQIEDAARKQAKRDKRAILVESSIPGELIRLFVPPSGGRSKKPRYTKGKK